MNGSTISPRIIPAAPADADEAGHAQTPPAPPRKGIDYAALVRRARLRGERRMSGALHSLHGTADEADISEATEAAKPDLNDDDAHDDTNALRDVETLTRLRERRLNELATPFIAALAQQQTRVAQLMHFLAARVADFCTDPAVIESGNWSIRIRLDAALLPDCTLHLTLSRFDLTLRFDTQSAQIRQLISRHEVILKNRLVSLLDELHTPRDVSIAAD
ncbi:MAG TPA: type III secretion system protein SctP [Paraburkholderia sp.]|jgi:type III secretion control protein HpaP